MDWNNFVSAAKTAEVSESTLDVLEAEGFDDKAEDLLKLTTQNLRDLRLEPDQVVKTSKVIRGFIKTDDHENDEKKTDEKTTSKEEKKSEEKNVNITGIQEICSKLLKNVGETVGFVLSEKKKEQKDVLAAQAKIDLIWKDLQRLADAANKLQGKNAIRQGAAQLIQSTQAFLQVVGAIGGGTATAGMKQTLNLVFERFEGSVTYMKLASTGCLTDISSSKLLAATAKGVEDRLLDVFNSCKRFRANSSVMASEKKQWMEISQGMWVSVKGVLETLKHLGRLIMQKSSKDQLVNSVKGARDMLHTLLDSAVKMDPSALKLTELEQDTSKLKSDLDMLECAIESSEAEKLTKSGDSAAYLRRQSRLAVAKSTFLFSACSNVVQALPELKELKSQLDLTTKPLVEFQVQIRSAVAEPKSTPAHTTLLRKAEEMGVRVDALAAAALAAVPIVKKVGDTKNLEKRINEAKGCFGDVKVKRNQGS